MKTSCHRDAFPLWGESIGYQWISLKKGHDDVINGHFFRVTGPLWRESTGHLTNPSDAELYIFFDLRLNKHLSKNRHVGDLRRHRDHYNVIVMVTLDVLFVLRLNKLLHCYVATNNNEVLILRASVVYLTARWEWITLCTCLFPTYTIFSVLRASI